MKKIQAVKMPYKKRIIMFVTTYRQDLKLESAKMLDMCNLPFIFYNQIKADKK